MVKSRKRWALTGFVVLMVISAIWPTMAIVDLVGTLEGYPYATEDPQAISPYGFPYRSSMDFVAWRLDQSGIKLHGKSFGNDWDGGGDPRWGDPPNWTVYATKLGFTVDHRAAVGAIAQWNSKPHVAMVTKVNDDGTIDVEEYAGLSFGKRTRIEGAENYIHLERSLPGGVWHRNTTPSGVLTGTAHLVIDADDNNNGGLDLVLITVKQLGEDKVWVPWRTILRTRFDGQAHGTVSHSYDLPQGVICARLSFDVFSRNYSIDGSQSRQLAPHGFRTYQREGQTCEASPQNPASPA